jgi:FkbM family methyltransferase
MKQLAKKLIRPLLRRSGFDLVRYDQKQLGVDPFFDMQHFLKGNTKPTIIDVGANVGQTARRFLDNYPGSEIHSFEPSPSTFEKLRANCASFPNVKCWNYGVGSRNETLEFIENDHSDMSSFLAPSKSSWGNVINKVNVPIVTLDSFTSEHDINSVQILKSDTQGFDFEVFKGAQRLMDENRIGLIYFEFIFSDMYENLPSFDEVFRYLVEKGYSLVSFYDFHFQNKLASWTDALFINTESSEIRVE